ncbi:MAG: hypothetical protein VX265_02420 [Myxococcota bacterium]|nr:hypothetical protein [Myxococcota bacterium]
MPSRTGRPDAVLPVAPSSRPDAPLVGSRRLTQRPDDAVPLGHPLRGADRDHPDAEEGRDEPSDARHDDHRTARPHPRHVRNRHPDAGHGRPGYAGYWGCYSGWWVHPYWRHAHGTWAVVWFPWSVDPWSPYWMPPARRGWTWMPGGWVGGVWWPGYYTPTTTLYIDQGVHYVYVPGWWERDAYVEGYWRRAQRDDGDWIWVDGYYLEDGVYVRGHWMPAEAGPEGYVWEAGFWDGEVWVAGFWRPQYRRGYRWVASYYDGSGVFVGGHWEPIENREGSVWIPGWFDGNGWVDGYWVTERAYRDADPDSWQPAAGWDAGREQTEAAPSPPPVLEDDAPLAVPIQLGG